uniref:Uncharacterized protein n=1 Tax=viral metagenome TaxID=1070528 RepID=A0A6C0ECY9_9ZZZZ
MNKDIIDNAIYDYHLNYYKYLAASDKPMNGQRGRHGIYYFIKESNICKILEYKKFVNDINCSNSREVKMFLNMCKYLNLMNDNIIQVYSNCLSIIDKIYLTKNKLYYEYFLNIGDFILSDYCLGMYKPKLAEHKKNMLCKKYKNDFLMSTVINNTCVMNETVLSDKLCISELTTKTDEKFALKLKVTKDIKKSLLNIIFKKSIKDKYLYTLKEVISRNNFDIKNVNFGMLYDNKKHRRKRRRREYENTKQFKNKQLLSDIFDILEHKKLLKIPIKTSLVNKCLKLKHYDIACKLMSYVRNKSKVVKITPEKIFGQLIYRRSTNRSAKKIKNIKVEIVKKYVDNGIIKTESFYDSKFRRILAFYMCHFDDNVLDYIINTIKTKPLFSRFPYRFKPYIKTYINLCHKYNIPFPLRAFFEIKNNKYLIKYMKDNNINPSKYLKQIKIDPDILFIKNSKTLSECMKYLQSKTRQYIHVYVYEALYNRFGNDIFNDSIILNKLLSHDIFNDVRYHKQYRSIMEKITDQNLMGKYIRDDNFTPDNIGYFLKCGRDSDIYNAFLANYKKKSAEEQYIFLGNLKIRLSMYRYQFFIIDLINNTKKTKQTTDYFVKKIMYTTMTVELFDCIQKNNLIPQDKLICIIIKNMDIVKYSLNKLNYDKYFSFECFLEALYECSHHGYKITECPFLVKLADQIFKLLSDSKKINITLLFLLFSKLYEYDVIKDINILMKDLFQRTNIISKDIYDYLIKKNVKYDVELKPVEMDLDIETLKLDSKAMNHLKKSKNLVYGINENLDKKLDVNKEYIKIITDI